MLAIPSNIATGTGPMLWVPLQGSPFGSDGLAIVIGLDQSYPSPAYQTITIVGNSADNECAKPGDFGSALVLQGANNAPGVVMLNDPACGLIVVDPSTLLVIDQSTPTTDPAYQFIAEDGAHSHPIFDELTSNLYFLDFSEYGASFPRVCCQVMSNYQDCPGWGQSCRQIPGTGTYTDFGQNTVQGKWTFMSLAFFANVSRSRRSIRFCADGRAYTPSPSRPPTQKLYISASGANRDDVAQARYGYGSALFVVVRFHSPRECSQLRRR